MELAGPLGTPLGLAQRKRASPRGEAGTSGFLSVSHTPESLQVALPPGQGSKEYTHRWIACLGPSWTRKNTGMGILSLLQGIFLIQESNYGLLHCRQILYQLS